MAKDEEKRKPADGVKNIFDDYNKRMTMSNRPDPSAKRNVGLNGALERGDQKDRLENLRIHGNETTGYGGNNPNSTEEFAQGPGFEFEGSDTAMSGGVNGIRTGDQPLGKDREIENPDKRDDEKGRDSIR
ncbi:hypothetical protein [Botryobacter ruber]|uniref:hypothetical protein n=1 Tax=Botryobacter ruber TaxID=2171629 RepID=UPI000E0C04B3|nr:hypothetical protein [Botryobacter ruber]